MKASPMSFASAPWSTRRGTRSSTRSRSEATAIAGAALIGTATHPSVRMFQELCHDMLRRHMAGRPHTSCSNSFYPIAGGGVTRCDGQQLKRGRYQARTLYPDVASSSLTRSLRISAVPMSLKDTGN